MRSDWIVRYAASVAVRRVVALLVLALLAWLGIGRAAAATYADRATASAACQSDLSAAQSKVTAENELRGDNYWEIAFACVIDPPSAGDQTYICNTNHGSSCAAFVGDYSAPQGGGAYYSWTTECPAGTEWSDAINGCYSREGCLDKSRLGNGIITATSSSGCIDGCAYGPPAGEGAKTLSYNGETFVAITKGWEPTGEACAADAPAPQTEGQQCKQLGDGQTACVKSDGQTCYRAHGGTVTQFCWEPGETGEKNDGPLKQVVNAGDNPIPPNMQLPSGDTLEQQGPPMHTTIHNDNRTINTTTTNYETSNGTDAGGGGGTSEDGEPGDGSGEDEAEDEGDEGSVTGGGDCATPPVTTGDAVLGAVVFQTWKARCEAEKANKGDADGDGQSDWTEQQGPPDVDGDEAEDGETSYLSRTFSGDMLDQSGFGLGGSCPSLGTLDFGFTTFSLDSWAGWCSLVAVLRAIVLLFGAYTAINILLGRN